MIMLLLLKLIFILEFFECQEKEEDTVYVLVDTPELQVCSSLYNRCDAVAISFVSSAGASCVGIPQVGIVIFCYLLAEVGSTVYKSTAVLF